MTAVETAAVRIRMVIEFDCILCFRIRQA